MSDTILELEHIEKHFGDTGVLHGVSSSPSQMANIARAPVSVSFNPALPGLNARRCPEVTSQQR